MLKWIQFPKFPLPMLAYNICNYLKWIIIFLVKFEVKNLNFALWLSSTHEMDQIPTHRDLATYQTIWISYSSKFYFSIYAKWVSIIL